MPRRWLRENSKLGAWHIFDRRKTMGSMLVGRILSLFGVLCGWFPLSWNKWKMIKSFKQSKGHHQIPGESSGNHFLPLGNWFKIEWIVAKLCQIKVKLENHFVLQSISFALWLSVKDFYGVLFPSISYQRNDTTIQDFDLADHYSLPPCDLRWAAIGQLEARCHLP